MDVKKYLPIVAIFLLVFVSLPVFFGKKNDLIIGRVAPNSEVIGMPLVQDTNPYTSGMSWGAPQEDRSLEARRFLAASLKISVSNASGSGTIVYYDPQKREAYVASCGHLWDGSKTAAEVARSPVNCKVITWYHNQTKLDRPREYPAQVIFWSNIRGYDCSLLKFQPDWTPEFFPIAPVAYPIQPGHYYNSVGCDSGGEVARYSVEAIDFRGDDLVTTKNSPRPGRSGGGLMSDDGFYIGTCWGTSETDGSGIGYFTPLKSIYYVYKNNGYGWLLEVGNVLARSIPIYDMNNPQKKYSNDYVPLPNNDAIPIPYFR